MPEIESAARKHVALVAHDHRKQTLLDWADRHRQTLARHALCATGTTGRLLRSRLELEVTCLARWAATSSWAR